MVVAQEVLSHLCFLDFADGLTIKESGLQAMALSFGHESAPYEG